MAWLRRSKAGAQCGVDGGGSWDSRADAWAEDASVQAGAEEGEAQALRRDLVAVRVRQAGDQAVQA
jgi:hypothetical protein